MTLLPEVERAVLDAIRREHRRARGARTGRWSSRLARARRGRPLALLAVLVLGGTSGALAATGVFRTGAPVGPGAQVVATAGNGVAIAGTARLTALRVADPGGGLAWGVKVVRTTRDETCIQVGRVDFGTVGVLGQDGAFRNDGRFHPLSPNFEPALNCGTADAHGNAFLNVVINDLPASGFATDCRPAGTPVTPGLPKIFRRVLEHEPTCPTGQLRNLFFGLLGPDATSVTYATPSGRLLTTPTSGRDGAYLIVLPYIAGGALCGPHRPVCPPPFANGEAGGSGGVGSADGVIRVVRYRDGRTCRLALPGPSPPGPGEQESCPLLGYAAPATRPVTAAQVTSPITVTVHPTNTNYCANGHAFAPCGAHPPPGFHRVPWPAHLRVTVSFISRVAITNSSSYYYIEIDNPSPKAPGEPSTCDPSNAVFGGTDSNYRAGQRVHDVENPPLCRGTLHGSVTLIVPIGPSVPSPMAPTSQSTNLPVGEFTIHVP